MDPSQIRQLANDYRNGAMSRRDYRAKRADMLNAILSGEAAIERHPMIFDPPASSDDKTQPGLAGKTAHMHQHHEPVKSPSWHGVSILAAVVVAIVIVAWLFADDNEEAQTSVATAGSPPAAVQNEPLASMTTTFLDQGNWTPNSVHAYREAIKGHLATRMTSDKNAIWLSRIRDAVTQQIQQNQALVDLDDAEATKLIVQLHELDALLHDYVSGALNSRDDTSTSE